MSALVDALTALGQQIAALNPTANAAHLATIDAHLTKLDTEEGADEATIADTTAALNAFVTAAKGTSSASGASSASGTSSASGAAAAKS
ncbi:MAG TPA: hypothetical protein VHW09_27005 [Bryobacteraceae bacterium]|nr:hypothetical protein [Bryobacteraceae bacterium]